MLEKLLVSYVEEQISKMARGSSSDIELFDKEVERSSNSQLKQAWQNLRGICEVNLEQIQKFAKLALDQIARENQESQAITKMKKENAKLKKKLERLIPPEIEKSEIIEISENAKKLSLWQKIKLLFKR